MSTAGPDAPEALQLLADRHRWWILRELSRSDRRVGELVQMLGAPQNLVSYHLAQLRDGGLVTSRRSSADGRDTYYRVDLRRFGNVLCEAAASLQAGLQLNVVPPDVHAPRRGRKPVVLFLCTGNSARSQMAEALTEHLSGGAVRARSAGSHPKTVHPNAVRVMAERGVDISDRAAKHFSRFASVDFDKVITLCDKVREICPEFPGPPPAAHWSMPDPAAEGDNDKATYRAFVHAADELEERIPFLLSELTTEARR